ncbi:VanZ family protein [Sphingomonas sp.]|uniref:VanZ family protein n=1 Tax=Sphingomonas sp. TaxID=28214 RepID=UPI002DF221AF|nr:VanZ family protein [Sphingomonas sp.]
MRTLFIALFWFAVLATLYVTLRPITVTVPGSDKTQHAITFGVLMGLAGLAYARTHLLKLAVALSAFGALIELVQPYFGRSRDVRDWIADSIGIAVVLVLLWAWRRWTSVRPQRG